MGCDTRQPARSEPRGGADRRQGVPRGDCEHAASLARLPYRLPRLFFENSIGCAIIGDGAQERRYVVSKLVAVVNGRFIYTSSDSGAAWTQR